jgi:hypothetical protein
MASPWFVHMGGVCVEHLPATHRVSPQISFRGVLTMMLVAHSRLALRTAAQNCAWALGRS